MKAVMVGNVYRYGAEFILKDGAVRVCAEHLPQLFTWIRRNASKIVSFQGNSNAPRYVDTGKGIIFTGVELSNHEENRDYFKVHSVCFAHGIPHYKYSRMMRNPNNLGYTKQDMKWMKHPESD